MIALQGTIKVTAFTVDITCYIFELYSIMVLQDKYQLGCISDYLYIYLFIEITS